MATELPFLGAGINLRGAWRWEVIRHRAELGAVECIPEEVVGPAGFHDYGLIRQAVPVLLHGIGLSLGSAEGLDGERVEHVAQAVEAVRPPWFSEHIAWTRARGLDLGHLAPLPFCRQAIDTVAHNVETLRRAIPGVPILLENIAYTLPMPGSTMTEAAFVREVVEAAGAYLLLDLENVHANSANHHYDSREYLESLPLERVIEVHLAGGIVRGGEYLDTHTRPVPEESWELLEWLVPRAPHLRVAIIERDADLPPFEELLAEVTRAHGLLGRPWDGSGGAAARAGR